MYGKQLLIATAIKLLLIKVIESLKNQRKIKSTDSAKIQFNKPFYNQL